MRTHKQIPRVVFFASGAFGLPVLDALLREHISPRWVITLPDAPAGRNRRPRPTPVRTRAEKHHAQVRMPADLGAPEFLSAIKHVAPDVFIIAAYGKILPKALLSLPKKGTLNIHPSLLPKYRGPSPVQAAILHGDAHAGVSIMLTDEKMDHGPILAQKTHTIAGSRVSAPELEARLGKEGAALLLTTLPSWLAGEINPQPQAHEQATYTKLLTKENGHIDWREPAETIERKIRAYQPWPSAYTFWKQENGRQMQLQLLRASVIPASEDTKLVGTVYAHKHTAICARAADDAFTVMTGDGALCISSLKPEGKKEMSATAFLAGHPEIIGATFI